MRRVNKAWFIMATALVAVTGFVTVLCWDSWWAEASAVAEEALESDIDAFISERVEAEGIPGVAVVVVQDSQVIYSKGFGTASLKSMSPVTPQTVFDLASCSKSFTALAVLLLREEGLLDLDLPVSHYLPDFTTSDYQMSQEITVRHLLNHSSGLPGKFAEPIAFYSGADAMEKLVESMERVHMNRAPGSSFEYSNLNYSLLGAIIEKVSGVDFEEYLEQRVFTPLGMTNTTMVPEEAEGLNRADGHQLLFGHLIARNIPIYRSIVPAGWVMSTAEDMGRWLIVHLNSGVIGEQQVIPAEVIEELHTPGVSYEENGAEVGYGMGWFIGDSDTGLSMLWHGGDTSNFSADMILVPDYRTGVSVLVNSQNSATVHIIGPGMASLVLGQELELPTAPWWASWRSADTIAMAAAAFSVIAFLVLIFYLWWRWRRFRRRRTAYLVSIHSKRLKIWRMVLPFTPLVLLMMAVAAIYVVVWLLFGFNLFQTLVRFGDFSPPGVWVAGWMMFAVICLWAIVLAAQTIFRYWVRRQFKNLSPQS
ncbi:MAG TPA: beta-lactamase family protein [Dehalococcoidia bacterium]|nr:beta-lactamase family protein [Dehalococcoidia bacterium]